MSQSDERLWTIEDVAKYCCVKTSVVRYWLQNSAIPHIRLGKHRRFDPDDIKHWVMQQKKIGLSGSNDADLRLLT